MDKSSIITAFITAIATIIGSYTVYKAAMTKSKHDYQVEIERMKMETENKLREESATTESIYIGGMEHVINEYKAQVESFRLEVEDLRKENLEIRQQISKLKESHRKELAEYKEYTDLLKKENKELREENNELKEEISTLKEEN